MKAKVTTLKACKKSAFTVNLGKALSVQEWKHVALSLIHI